MPTVTTIEKKQRIKEPWVEIHLGVLEENIRAMQAALRPGTEIIFVVKANAYGHGALAIASRAAEAGVKWFAVAYLREALELRRHLPGVHLLVLGVVDPADVALMLENRIIPVVVSEQHGLELAESARVSEATLPVHLKIDTGMGRLGVPWEEGGSALSRLCREPGLDVQGLCSHFAAVEPDHRDSAEAQFERFSVVADAEPRKLFKHLSSSRAFLYHPDWDLDGIRTGMALYGYGTGDPDARMNTRPALQWKSTVTQVKHVPANTPVGYYGTHVTPSATNLATIALGYADGYLRTLSNRGHVLIRGKRCAVVGRVSMNWLTVDVGHDSEICAGDEVVLIGEQNGEAIWADELAEQCRTIPYEILTGINPAIERKNLG